MTLSKKQQIFEKTREIISKYELTGISKNNLILELQHEQVASRMTVLEYFPEMVDPKRGNIIEQRIPKGKINPICYPTKSNLALVKLKGKFKFVSQMLDMIEKYPELGDCFIPLSNIKNLFKREGQIPPNSGNESNPAINFEIIHSKNSSFGDFHAIVTLRFHRARHDFLKELLFFLTWYLNIPKAGYSKQVKEESIKILTPIFLRALKIIHDDYSDTINASKQAYQMIKNKLPRDSVLYVHLIKSATMPHVEVEFLIILGRYYYTISEQFSKNMKFDSSNEQRLISNFITSFYKSDNSNVDSDIELDLNDIKRIIKLGNNFNNIRNREQVLKDEYGFDSNSIAIRLGLYNDDALHIKIYYLELFLSLGLFNQKEFQFLNYILNKEKEKLSTLKPIDLKEQQDVLSLVKSEFNPDKF